MRLGIQGSRTIDTDEARTAIERAIERDKPSHIVTSAKIEGVCRLAREIADENRIALTVHFANEAYAAGMHEKRSKAVQADCHRVHFIWDGQSAGTRHEIEMAIATGKPHSVIIMKPAEKPPIDPETDDILKALTGSVTPAHED
jgi:hypothetical protein